MCQAWDLQKFVLRTQKTGIRKWAALMFDTLRVIRKCRPDILLVQNPSLGLAMLAVAVKPLFRFFLVIDAHNEGVQPYIRQGRFITWVTSWLLRSADRTIVTNSNLANVVEKQGGNAIVLPDALPEPPVTAFGEKSPVQGKCEFVIISTFAPDEPLRELLGAARQFPDVAFFVTGRHSPDNLRELDVPGNVTLTGFLPDDDYWRRLATADVIVDLTLMPDCLVCGAYEALSLAKPMVLSDNQPGRQLFGEGVVFADVSEDGILQAFRRATEDLDALRSSAVSARHGFKTRWINQAATVWTSITGAAAARLQQSEGTTGV